MSNFFLRAYLLRGYSSYSSYFGLNSDTFKREEYTFMECSTTSEGTVVNFKDKEYIYWNEGAEYDSKGNEIHHINSKGDEEWYEYEYDSNDRF